METAGYAEVNAALLACGRALLDQWLGSGRLEGGELAYINPLRPGGHSLKIKPDSGKWADFAPGSNATGGDLVSLYAYLNGLNQPAALKALAQQYALGGNGNGHHTGNGAGPNRGERRRQARNRGEHVATYDYIDKDSQLRHQVLRYEKEVPNGKGGTKKEKTFLQRRPCPSCKGQDRGDKECKGGWIWNLDGVEPVPYGLPDIMKSEPRPSSGKLKGVAIPEGEKCVDALKRINVLSACNSGGAGKWQPELNPYFDGRSAALFADNDQAGERDVLIKARNLKAHATEIKIVYARDLGLTEPGDDVADWIEARERQGKTPEEIKLELLAIIEKTPVWEDGADRTADHDQDGVSDYDQIGIYRARNTPPSIGFTRVAYDREGEEFEVPLSNFVAKITAETLRDDGEQSVRHYEIEAVLREIGKRRANVPAADFNIMKWVGEQLGTKAIILAGRDIKDRVREAIQQFSMDAVERVMFTHTGWRFIDKRWIYLHAEGCIGAEGSVADVSVDLPAELAPFILPAQLKGDELKEAVRACLDLLDLAPDRITAAVVCVPWRAVLGDSDSSVFPYGRTGEFKTELTALVMQHFGAGFHSRRLPAEWTSTGGALETTAWITKDAPLVIDDFNPPPLRIEREKLNHKADWLFRGQANKSGRKRLRTDASLRAGRAPRCLPLSSGEDIPSGWSLNSRILFVELRKGDIPADKLTSAQQDAAKGRFAGAMAAYLCWLAPRLDAEREKMKDRLKDLRAQASHSEMHRRTPGIVADLFVGFEIFMRFAVDVGAIDESKAGAIKDRVWNGLTATAAEQSKFQRDQDPARRFIELLRAAIASGAAHLANSDGDRPLNAVAWGWRQKQADVWEERGPRVGWIEGDDLYLDADASLRAAQQMVADGNSIPVSVQTLGKRLRDGGALASTGYDVGRETLKVQRVLQGGRLDVLHLKLSELDSEVETTPTVAKEESRQ